METMRYKGLMGSIETALDENLLHGKLLHINGLITYEATTLAELKSEFEQAVDDYLAFCHEKGIEPQKAFTGKFNVRIAEDKHKQMATLALQRGLSLNALVSESIDLYLQQQRAAL